MQHLRFIKRVIRSGELYDDSIKTAFRLQKKRQKSRKPIDRREMLCYNSIVKSPWASNINDGSDAIQLSWC